MFKIIKKITVPTGEICIMQANKGNLEFVSLHDYGKAKNIKADFLGYTKEINQVPHGDLLPLEEKWVVTISTQYGCSMNCKFCLLPDAPILMSDYTYKAIKDVKLGDSVISNINPSGNNSSPIKQYASTTTKISSVTGLVKRQYSGNLIKVKTQTGKELICTEEHPVARKHKTRILYDYAKNLVIGDSVVVCNHVQETNLKCTEWLLGWCYGIILSDGVFTNTDTPTWQISQNSLNNLLFCIKNLQSFGLKPSNYWKNSENNYRFALQGKQLDLFMKMITASENTELFKIGFLAGFWDGDGFSFKHNSQARFCNTTLSNIHKIESYLKDLGYAYKLSKKSSKVLNHKPLYILDTNISRDEFISKFTPINSKKQYLEKTRSRKFSFMEKIVSIEKYEYTGLVYNIETTEHSYFAYDFLNHNCDVPKVGKGLNATYEDLKNQILNALSLHPEVQATKRLNIHYARMGEPTWNKNVLDFTKNVRKIIRPYIGRSLVHPVISTMLPKDNKFLNEYLNEWIDIKNDLFRGDAGLQFSINTTNDNLRDYLFSGNSLNLEEISKIGDMLDMPKGRKYALNFAIGDTFEVNAEKLRDLFNPNKFMVKITPIHLTNSCKENNIVTSNGYFDYSPYRDIENKLKQVGFDVLVFIPSVEEDSSRITCGNAILSNCSS